MADEETMTQTQAPPAAAAPAPVSEEAKPEDAQKKENTISNLPLLFANGYPTSLEKITEAQLHKFIPFMVQCSLGNVQPSTSSVEAPANAESSENPTSSVPAWWPEDIPFAIPLVKPESIPETDWTRKLKELVCMCYEYHNNVFLLRFCTVLSKYEPECLRFINNYNSTTSLYDRFNNKLLVTFRNENMLYDREPTNRKCLLPHRKQGVGSGSATPGDASQAAEEADVDESGPSMVEPPLFDIYLCDYCDAELYSLEACREHERTCQEVAEQADEDSDVILCDDGGLGSSIVSSVKRRPRKRAAPERGEVKARKRKQNMYEEVEVMDYEEDYDVDSNDGVLDGPSETGDNDEDQARSFLSMFNLVSAKGNPSENWPKQSQRSPRKSGGRSPVKMEKNKKKAPRTDRSVLTLQRCATVPLTSPMGRFLLRTQKGGMVTGEYRRERNDRLERFCVAPVIRDGHRPRWLTMTPTETFPVTFRAIDYRGMFDKHEGYDRKYVHQFRFPRRQLSSRSKELQWAALTKVLLKSCTPCSVELVRLTQTDIRVFFLHMAIERKKRELMELRRADLMRMFKQQEEMKKLRGTMPVECIDLCESSDEEGDGGGATKRMRVQSVGNSGAEADDETKENRMDALMAQYVKIMPKTQQAGPNGLLGSHLPQQQRNHSAMGNGDVMRPLSVATHITGSWSSTPMAQGSPQTAAQLGVILPNNEPPHGGRSSNNSGNLGVGPYHHHHNNVIEQPSSYLFLTKQQLVYQQLEVTSTESNVVLGNEVEEEVVVESTMEEGAVIEVEVGTSNVAVTEPQTPIPVAVQPESNGASVLGQVLNQEQASTTTTTITNSINGRVPTKISIPMRSAHSLGAHASEASSAGRIRRTSASVCDSFQLNKKMPSLIRIAPA